MGTLETRFVMSHSRSITRNAICNHLKQQDPPGATCTVKVIENGSAYLNFAPFFLQQIRLTETSKVSRFTTFSLGDQVECNSIPDDTDDKILRIG